jgi:NADH-quinone oxidoreductase subunit N
MPSLADLRLLGPLWVLAGTIVAVLLAALLVGRSYRVAGGVATLGGILSAVVCWRMFTQLSAPFSGIAPTAAGPMLIVDQFSLFFIFLISVFLVLVTGMWFVGIEARPNEEHGHRHDAVEFFVLFVGSAFGMSLMVSTANLLMIVLAVESASLPSYALAGFRKKHRLGAEASIKYVLFGAVTSAIMIYGASLLYGQFHTLDLVTLSTALAHRGITVISGVALFAFMVGVAFKVSAVPFHFWCPDVFEGASIEVTTWLSVASKAAGLGLMLRIVSVLSGTDASQDAMRWVAHAVAIMAAITCTVGNFSAFRQTNMKRLLAFSSIAHAGYMLMAVAILWRPDGSSSDPAHPGYSAVVAYIAVYLLMNLCAFGVVAMVYWATGKETLDAFRGLGWRNPVLGVAMATALFSLVGLPPLGGFIIKWYLLIALYNAGLVWLVFVAVFNTLLSLYYYARIVYAMYFVQSDEAPVRPPAIAQLAVTLCAAGIFFAGTFWAGPLKRFADARSRDMFTSGQNSPGLKMAESHP